MPDTPNSPLPDSPPLSADEWQHHARWLLLPLSVLLLGSALIFFLAYNWAELHHFAKFALAASALMLCAAGAWGHVATPVIWPSCLLGASLSTGALLALIGQTYQTGADTWQLFALWGLLITPFAFLSRSAACWLLWLVVVNLAGWLAWETRFWNLSEDADQIVLLAGANLVLLVVFERAARQGQRPHQTRVLPRVICAWALGLLTFAACQGWWEGVFHLSLLVFWSIAAALTWYYHQKQPDLFMVACCLYACVTVLTFGLARQLDNNELFSVSLLTLCWIALSSAASAYLHRQTQQARFSCAAASPSPHPTERSQPFTSPWWLKIALILAAWISALLVVATVLAANLLGSQRSVTELVCGIGLCFAAYLLMRKASLFREHMALAFSVAGQLLIMWACANVQGTPWSENLWAWVGAAVALFMLLLPGSASHRCVCAVLLTLTLAFGVRDHIWLLTLAFTLWAAYASHYWLRAYPWPRSVLELRRPSGTLQRGLAWAAALSTLSAPALLKLVDHPSIIPEPFVAPLALGLAAVALSVAYRVSRTARFSTRLAAGVSAVILVVCTLSSPGLIAAGALVLASLAGRQRLLYVLALLSGVAYLFMHYYQQHTTLLEKSAWLTASGLLVLALYGLLHRNAPQESQL